MNLQNIFEINRVIPVFDHPEHLYHVTEYSNLAGIKQYGLIPKIGYFSKAMGETTKAIYLFGSIKDVQKAMRSWMGEEYEDLAQERGVHMRDIRLVILKVAIPKHIPIKEVGYEYQITKPIPPKYIRVVNTI